MKYKLHGIQPSPEYDPQNGASYMLYVMHRNELFENIGTYNEPEEFDTLSDSNGYCTVAQRDVNGAWVSSDSPRPLSGDVTISMKSPVWTAIAIRNLHDALYEGILTLPETKTVIKQIVHYGDFGVILAWSQKQNFRVMYGTVYGHTVEYDMLPALSDSIAKYIQKEVAERTLHGKEN